MKAPLLSLLTVMACLALGAAVAAAEGEPEAQPTADARFKEAYRLLSLADDARDREAYEEAINGYRKVLDLYLELARQYPQWQPAMVRFRITYCDDQLNNLVDSVKKGRIHLHPSMPPLEPASNAPPATATMPPPPVPGPEPPAPPLTDAGSSAPDTASAGPADDPLSKARRLMRAGEAEHARALIFEQLKREPDSVEVRLLMGVVQCQNQKFEDAVFILTQLSEDAPQRAEVFIALATAYLGIGHLDRVRASLETAIKLDPQSPQAHFDMAQILIAQETPDMEAATTHYRRSVELGGERDPRFESAVEPEPERLSTP
jgi:tetratricopeptide (TPR) repeat protein